MKLQSIAKLLSNRINQEHYVLHYLHQVYNAGIKKGKNLPPSALKKSEESEGWISVNVEPDLGPGWWEGNTFQMLYSKEFICFDGNTVFVDSYNIDEGFHKSITHYRPFPDSPHKKNISASVANKNS